MTGYAVDMTAHEHSHYPRELFELLSPDSHAAWEALGHDCPCADRDQWGEAMRWTPAAPIVRFGTGGSRSAA